MTQSDLARAITPVKTTQATVSAIERGIISSEYLLPICRFLNVSPPSIGASPELARWIDLGRTMSQHPSVFAYHLEQLEKLAQALRDGQPTSEPPDGHSTNRDDASKKMRR